MYENNRSKSIKVGAGSGEMIFPEAMFPMPEGFVKTHDNPHARVLIIKGVEEFALISMELVNTPPDTTNMIKEIVSRAAAISKENVWVHSIHVYSTPHAPDDAVQRKRFNETVRSAVEEAVEEAVGNLQSALMGIGTGQCDLIANRNVLTAKGWVSGINGQGITDHTMTVIRFENLEGELLTILFLYAMKSFCTDVKRGTPNREITSDVTGVAASMLENEFGVPVMFFASACADQYPVDAAQRVELDEHGNATFVDLGVQAGLQIAKKLGTRMGDFVGSLARSIRCTLSEPNMCLSDTSFDWLTISKENEMRIQVSAAVIGDLALVAVKPEVNCITALQLKKQSPYEHTVLLTFVNGDQKYMPDKENYDSGKPESENTGLARGGAERFVEVASELLRDMFNGNIRLNSSHGKTDTASNYIEHERITFGGMDWRVLDYRDNKKLIISDKAITSMAYKADGCATTWEESDVRIYLNNDFYNQFATEEKNKICETENTNEANVLYGTSGGKNTLDRVFLLSCNEVERYFPRSEDRVVHDQKNNTAMWLLRTPGRDREFVCNVNSSGYLDEHGILVMNASNNSVELRSVIKDYASGVNGSIRPAMWILSE